MRAWLWSCLCLIACGDPDPVVTPDAGCAADQTCVTWEWTFLDPGTGTVPCPSEVTGIRLVAEERGYFESSYAVFPRGDVIAACSDGQATLHADSRANTYRLEAIAGDRVYAKVPLEVDTRDAVVEIGRGWAQVAWTFHSESMDRDLSCGEAGQLGDISDLRITTTDVTDTSRVQVDEVTCAAGMALTSGVRPSPSQVTFTWFNANATARQVVDLGVLEIDEGEVTDFGTATIMMP